MSIKDMLFDTDTSLVYTKECVRLMHIYQGAHMLQSSRERFVDLMVLYDTAKAKHLLKSKGVVISNKNRIPLEEKLEYLPTDPMLAYKLERFVNGFSVVEYEPGHFKDMATRFYLGEIAKHVANNLETTHLASIRDLLRHMAGYTITHRLITKHLLSSPPSESIMTCNKRFVDHYLRGTSPHEMEVIGTEFMKEQIVLIKLVSESGMEFGGSV